MGGVSVVPPVYLAPPDRSGVVELQHVSRIVKPVLAERERNLLRFVVVEEVKQAEERNEETDDGEDPDSRGEERYEDNQDFRGSFQVSFLDFSRLFVEGQASFETPQD